jgi:hypothetical protein
MKLETAITTHINGDVQQNALRFVAYLRNKGAEIGDSDNYFYHPTYKGKELCVINVEINDDGSTSFDTMVSELPTAWDVWPVPSLTERDILWTNTRPCEDDCDCGNKNRQFIILGKTVNNLCGCYLGVYGPDAETTDFMIKLMDALMRDIG